MNLAEGDFLYTAVYRCEGLTYVFVVASLEIQKPNKILKEKKNLLSCYVRAQICRAFIFL